MKDDRIKETDNAPIEAEDLELISGGRIYRPAYKNVSNERKYIPIKER